MLIFGGCLFLEEYGIKFFFNINRELKEWNNFVKAVRISLQPEIHYDQIDELQNLLESFYQNYER